MTYFLLILSILVWPFGQLLTFHLPGAIDTVYLLDICLGLLTLSLWIGKGTRNKILADPLFKPIFIFCGVAVLSLLFNYRSLLAGGFAYPLLYLGRLFIYPSVYFALKIFPSQNNVKIITISFAAFCVLGLTQYLFFPDMRYLYLIGFDDHYYRLIGSFYDPNFTGAILAGASLLFISTGNWPVSFAVIGLMALTFSRASYIAFAIGMTWLLISRKKYYHLIFLLILGLFIWFIPKPFGEGVNLWRTFSIFSRIDSWQAGLNLFIQRPIFGWGYNTLRAISGERFQIDNSFLFIAATTGLAGLIAVGGLLKHSLVLLSIPQKVFIVAILVHSLFNNSLFYIWIFFAFWLVLALPLKGYKSE